MQYQKKISYLFVLLSLLFLIAPTFAWASEGDSEKSASVQTKGAITFESTVDSTTPSTEEPPTSSSSVPATTLPNAGGGKLPQTGERKNQGLIISGITLLFALLLFFFWKEKRNKQGNNKGGISK